jgi:tRNA(Ile)-lysidine synthase
MAIALVNHINHFIQKHTLLPPGSRVILGLSGGPDSMFLLHFLYELHKKGSIELITAHLDHQWRVDSCRDVLLCQKATESLGIPLIVKTMADLNLTHKPNGSLEETGRKARRFFLETVCKEQQAHCIALAHHRQDQEETFFIRLIRGTSLSGLIGMRPKHGLYIRPLLETHKAAMIDYLNTNGIAFITDPSNESFSYLRNRIRSNVLPALHTADARFDNNFLTTLHRLNETEEFLTLLTKKRFEKICTADNQLSIQYLLLQEEHPVMQYRLIVHWLTTAHVPFPPTQPFLDEIIRFLMQPTNGTHKITSHWAINKKNSLATIKSS